MISALRLCPKCGVEIPVDAPEGGCPGCLLQNGIGLLLDPPVAAGDASTVISTEADYGSSAEDVELNGAAQAGQNKKAASVAETLGELGNYELLEEIGRGGQGVVFRARQKSLNRTVALKVISLGQWASRAHLKRFRREALAAASLDHPGIVPIYEVGQSDGSCYFSMRFVEGGQLDQVIRRKPMSIRQAAEVVAKVARTVHYAHQHGILHRDIKPGNILLDAKDEPHLTDFGLARLVEAESTVTRTKEVMGTPSYMAPEQAAGNNDQLTRETDVYGLGAVLYHLLTSHPPFTADTTYETIRLLVEADPREPRLLNPKVDRELSAICLKCLEKDPKRRYASAFALAEDLEHWLKHEPIRAKRSGILTHAHKWVQRNPAIAALVASLIALAAAVSWNIWKSELFRPPPEKSIAVLPFENLSHDPDTMYFADGIQEEILTRLASIADLRVISRSSTQQYQSNARNLRAIAKQLGVVNIVEGSVQKAADQVRVNVQLVNAQTDSHLWAESYDRKLTDIFAVESEIAKRIAEALQANLSPSESHGLAAVRTHDTEAYDLFLRGEYELHQAESSLATEAYDRADAFYRQALARDPNFAEAAEELARSRLSRHWTLSPLTVTQLEEVKSLIDQALALAPNSPEAHFALGLFFYEGHRQYEMALTEFNRTLELQPNNALARQYRAYVYRRRGEWELSLADLQRAEELDPRDAGIPNGIGETYLALRQWKDAERAASRALAIDPHHSAAA